MVTFPWTIQRPDLFARLLVRSHRLHDTDEMMMLYLITRFATQEFLEVNCVGEECLPPGETVRVLELGVGDGPLNEHPKNGHGRSAGSGTMLVAKKLRVEKNRRVKGLIAEIDRHDEQGSKSLNLARSIDNLHRVFPNDPLTVTQRAHELFQANYLQQEAIIQAQHELEKIAQWAEIAGPSGRPLRLVWAISVNEDLPAGAWRLKNKPDIFVQQFPSDAHILQGNVQMYTKPLQDENDAETKALKLAFVDVVRMINVAEQLAAGQKEILCQPDILSAEGQIPGGRWWYFPSTGALFNGNRKHINVPATRLPLSHILQYVKWAMDDTYFDVAHQERCLEGVCTAMEKPCPFRFWHLQRCLNCGLKPSAKFRIR